MQKKFSTNEGDLYFDIVISKEEKDTTLAASCVQDSKTGGIILKMENAGNEAGMMNINLASFKKINSNAEPTGLTGAPDAENKCENPHNDVQVRSASKVKSKFEYETPAMSLTIIRMKTKK